MPGSGRTADINDRFAGDPPGSGYFPQPDAVPDPLLVILAGQLGIETAHLGLDTAGLRGAKSLYRYHRSRQIPLRRRGLMIPAAESKITGASFLTRPDS